MGKTKFEKRHNHHKALITALDAGYQHYSSDIFRWMLEAYLHLVGAPSQAMPDIPDSAAKYVRNTLDTYIEAVQRSEPFEDVMGSVYMECASHWGRSEMGQYFTAQTVADTMALMLLGTDTHDHKPDGQLWRVIDPCVGSGVMLLSMSRAILRDNGPDALKHWSMTGVDLDRTCSMMFAVQMLANCAVHGFRFGEIVALTGNSLSHSPMDYKLVMHAMSPDAPAQPPATHPVRIDMIARSAAEAGVQPSVQLGLFEKEKVACGS